jgi:hypothetical protein
LFKKHQYFAQFFNFVSTRPIGSAPGRDMANEALARHANRRRPTRSENCKNVE